MDELRDLMGLGASGIVLLDHQYEETASTHADTTTNTYACKIGGKAFEIELAWSTNAYKMGQPVRVSERSRKSLTETQYKVLIAGKPFIDTPDALKKIKVEDARNEKIRALTPDCPECGSKMQHKTGPYGDFWGCSRFPRCNGKRKMTAAYLKLVHG